MTEPQADDLIPHDGGPCPIPIGATFYAKFRDGRGMCLRAVATGWRHANRPHDIVAYRVVSDVIPIPPGWEWRIGTRVRKRSGSSWHGLVCGYYSTKLTTVGYCVESEREPGSTQIYPAAALEAVEEGTP